MLLSIPFALALLVSLCSAEYYHVIGEGFKDYIGDSSFHVEPYVDISIYGIPPPPGGNNALYLTDNTLLTQTPIFHIPSSQVVNLHFTFFCDDSPSQLEIRMSYPWEGQDIVLCGQNSAIARPGVWVTEIFTRECYDTCANFDLWLYGATIAEGHIVGIHSISLTTDDSTFAPTDITQSTSTIPTTSQPACLSPGSSCASGHGTCRSSCNSNEYSYGSCGGASCSCCKLYWPYGRYSLPKPSEGCPDPTENTLFTWATGYSRERTYPSIAASNHASVSHMAGHTTDDYVYKHYCTKTSSSTGHDNWPAGDYCIYRYGGSCPSGFNLGHIAFDETDTDSATNYHTGTVPDGSFDDGRTTIEYCCRSDGYYNTAIKLPTEHPFLLMMNTGRHCQEVEGMSHVEQYITVNTIGDASYNDSQMSGDFPYTCYYTGRCYTSGTYDHPEDPRVYYCYYY